MENLSVVFKSQTESRRLMSQLKREERGISLLPSFCSIQSFHGLDEAWPHLGGQSALLGLKIQILISFLNTLIIHTPRK